MALGLAAALVGKVQADTWQPLEAWRIGEGRVAPWAGQGTQVNPAYRGKAVRFEAARVVAPAPIACESVQYEWIFTPATGLFEGNLPAPAVSSARRLGIDTDQVATLRITCPNAGFDFHRDGRGNLLLGLDNVVWQLLPVRAATQPAEIVQELLITHFTHDMGFSPQSVALKRAHLSPGLSAAMAAWFAAPSSPDEVPEISGDPFTDSQEYPDRFTLGPAQVTASRATVPVHFADGRAVRTLHYVLVREGKDWLLDDVLDERGGKLRAVLAAAAARGAAVVYPDESFDAFFARFRAALASDRAADVAALVNVPFLFDGNPLDRPGVARIVPELFTAKVKQCLATVQTMPEEGRQVAFCKPYAFYFGRGEDGYRLIEFAADGEDVP